MCDEYELFEFLESDFSHQNRESRNKRRRLRYEANAFDMDEIMSSRPYFRPRRPISTETSLRRGLYYSAQVFAQTQVHSLFPHSHSPMGRQSDTTGERSGDEIQFIQRYRLTKDLVLNLCEELRPHMSGPTKSTDLSVETKVLVALSFYATGSYQRPTGDIGYHSISQPTVSTVIKQITGILNLPQLQAKYITFPSTSQERRANVVRFYNKFGMPGVLGCVDCSHIAIIHPNENEERYYCRKQYHSLNVQLISNADQEVISVDASYGGATHDSFIWGNHPLKHHMEELSQNESIWLLGDSGYPLRKHMRTPITNTAPGTQEAYYTEVHVRTRNVIERTIGLLKACFRCLLVHRVLHYTPQVAASIVNACVVLHNMSVRANLPVPELTEEEAAQEATMQQMDGTHHGNQQSTSSRELNEGLAVRRALVSRLWASHRTNN